MANRSELSSVFDQQLATKPRKWGKVANLTDYEGLQPVYMAVVIFGRLGQSVGVGVDGHLLT